MHLFDVKVDEISDKIVQNLLNKNGYSSKKDDRYPKNSVFSKTYPFIGVYDSDKTYSYFTFPVGQITICEVIAKFKNLK